MSRKAKFTTEETLRILLDISPDGGSDLEEDNVDNNDSNYKSDAENVENSLSGSEYKDKSTKNSSFCAVGKPKFTTKEKFLKSFRG